MMNMKLLEIVIPTSIYQISILIQMDTLFKSDDEINTRRCDKSIHKATRITVDIHQTNKNLYVTVQPKNACKLEFADHLLLQFLDPPRSEIVVFPITNYHIYNIILT